MHIYFMHSDAFMGLLKILFIHSFFFFFSHSFYLLYLANKTIDNGNKMQFFMAICKYYSIILNGNLHYSFLPLILLIPNNLHLTYQL